MLRIRQFISLSALTALEALRQPICLLLTTSCVLLTALVPVTLMHRFGEEGRLVRDSGLAFQFVFGMFVAGYAACSSLSREMRSGTASVVLSKPVGRDLFFLAKFTGIMAVIAAFCTCATLATLLAERVDEKFIAATGRYVTDSQTAWLLFLAPAAAFAAAGIANYRRKKPFTSTAFISLLVALLLVLVAAGFFDRAGRFQPFDFRVQWRSVSASALEFMALGVLAAAALMFSTRLSTVPTLTLCGVLLVLGLVSDYLFGLNAATSRLAKAAYWICPNWQHFWVSDVLGHGAVPAYYLWNAALYAALYCGGLLVFGILSFRHAEMK